MGHPCKISAPQDHYIGRQVVKFGKIRTLNFENPNSGKSYPRPMGHPCKILAPWDHWCGRESRTDIITDTGTGVAIIYKDLEIEGNQRRSIQSIPQDQYRFGLVQFGAERQNEK